jgi:hypothetical protein
MHSSKKHLVIMILCCLIPVAGLVTIRLFGIPVSTGVYIGLMMLCLISHVLLMRFMMGREGHGTNQLQTGPSAANCHTEQPGEQTQAAKQLPARK